MSAGCAGVEKRIKALVAGLHAVGHAGGEGGVAGLPRAVAHGDGHEGPSVFSGEAGGDEGLPARPVLVEEFGRIEPGRALDALEAAAHGEVFALGAAPDVAVASADP